MLDRLVSCISREPDVRFTPWKLLLVLAIALAGFQEWQRSGLAAGGNPGCGGVCGAVRSDVSPRAKVQHLDENVPAGRLDCPEGSSDCENPSDSNFGWGGASAARATVPFGWGYVSEASPASAGTNASFEPKPLNATSRIRC
jgi:hypothetical protein